jgi:hypothetical protein
MPTDSDPSPAVALNRVTTHAQRPLDALTAQDDCGGFRACASCGENRPGFRHREARR